MIDFMKKHWFWPCIGILLGLIIFLAIEASVRSGTGAPTATNGMPATGVTGTLPVPLFKQNDPRWGEDELGGSKEKLRNAGCTVSCVAMVFAHYGVEATPQSLNAFLKASNGYTDRGLLKWDACVAYSRGRVAVAWMGDVDMGRIDASLDAGDPVIAKVMVGSVPHWVVIVGGRAGEYLVNDPLGPETEPVPIARFGERILAARVFRKTA